MIPLTEHERWMRRCLALAQEAADAGEAPVGAVVVQQGREIAAARNEREACLLYTSPSPRDTR